MSKTVIDEPPHLVADLKTLKLPTMATQWLRQAEEARRGRQTHPEYLAELAALEVQRRRERRIQQ